jgi:hypothetical protein
MLLRAMFFSPFLGFFYFGNSCQRFGGRCFGLLPGKSRVKISFPPPLLTCLGLCPLKFLSVDSKRALEVFFNFSFS